jgi:large subunit ribosomal protein L30
MSGENKKIRITLVRSPIGRQPVQRRTVRALGLKRLNHSVVQRESPEILGMVDRVQHLVRVEPWQNGEEGEKGEKKGEEGG